MFDSIFRSMSWLSIFWDVKPRYSYWLARLCNCCVYILHIFHPTLLMSIIRDIIVSNKSNIKKWPEIKYFKQCVFISFNFLYFIIFFQWLPLPIRSCGSLATFKKYLNAFLFRKASSANLQYLMLCKALLNMCIVLKAIEMHTITIIKYCR